MRQRWEEAWRVVRICGPDAYQHEQAQIVGGLLLGRPWRPWETTESERAYTVAYARKNIARARTETDDSWRRTLIDSARRGLTDAMILPGPDLP